MPGVGVGRAHGLKHRTRSSEDAAGRSAGTSSTGPRALRVTCSARPGRERDGPRPGRAEGGTTLREISDARSSLDFALVSAAIVAVLVLVSVVLG